MALGVMDTGGTCHVPALFVTLTDPGCQAHNGSAQGCVFAPYKHQYQQTTVHSCHIETEGIGKISLI